MSDPRLVLRCGASLLFIMTGACSFVGFDGFVGTDERMDVDNKENDAGTKSPSRDDPLEDDDDVPPLGDGGIDENRPIQYAPPVFVDGGSFCTSTEGTAATFCDDFDTEDLPSNWIREGLYGKLTSHEPKSTPNVFLVDAPQSAAGGTFVSKISRDFDDPSTHLLVEFDFKPERINEGTAFLMLAAVEWVRGASKYSLRLVYSNGSVRLEESNLVPPPNNQDTYHPFFTLPMNQWTRVSLDIEASGASAGVQISLDGKPSGKRAAISPSAEIDPRPSLLLGAVFASSPHTGWTFRYDNVTLTYQ